jgi:hypothetical protein
LSCPAPVYTTLADGVLKRSQCTITVNRHTMLFASDSVVVTLEEAKHRAAMTALSQLMEWYPTAARFGLQVPGPYRQTIDREHRAPTGIFQTRGVTLAEQLPECISEDFCTEFKNPVSIKCGLSGLPCLGKYISAYLNSGADGGSIVFGISDDRIVSGYEWTDKEKDRVLQAIANSVFRDIVPGVNASLVRSTFIPVAGSTRSLLEVAVLPPIGGLNVYVWKNVAYVKRENTVTAMDHHDLIQRTRISVRHGVL